MRIGSFLEVLLVTVYELSRFNISLLYRFQGINFMPCLVSSAVNMLLITQCRCGANFNTQTIEPTCVLISNMAQPSGSEYLLQTLHVNSSCGLIVKGAISRFLQIIFGSGSCLMADVAISGVKPSGYFAHFSFCCRYP
jgi:hypothetical protein